METRAARNKDYCQSDKVMKGGGGGREIEEVGVARSTCKKTLSQIQRNGRSRIRAADLGSAVPDVHSPSNARVLISQR